MNNTQAFFFRQLSAIILTGACILSFFPVQAQVFNPAADTYIHDANASTNYGTLPDLYAKKGSTTNHRKTYLKFDLTNSGIGVVTTAIIRLYASTTTAVTMNVYPVADSWTETGLTWNNAPAAGTLLASSSMPAAAGYYDWDITAYVQSQFMAGDKLISLVFYPGTITSPSILFNSREAAANKPELVVNNNMVPPSAPVNLVATAVSFSQIDLSWEDSSTTETGFKIESRIGSAPFAEVATLGPDITNWSDTGLPAGTKVVYRAYAYNISGSSGFSNMDSATTAIPLQVSYYVDAVNGNDNNDGLSPSTAWKSLAKVNATTFTAGNRIFFKSGAVWTGRLYPKGSGIPGSPIIIDKYGSGAKPLINGNGMTGTGVFYLYNQQQWEVNNLEITNDAATGGDRRGVRIEVENFGTANHIYLKNLNVHHVKGLVGQGRPEKRTGGIGFAIVDVALQESHFNDILVENCVITACDNQGIITECVSGDGFDPYSQEWNAMKITNAVIRNNTISEISKNAMIIRLFEGGVVENNLCYNTANGITGNTIFSASCNGTVFQYNEGYGNHSPDADGSFYDADLRSPNTYWQYSYSHDNAHGLFWTCTVQADANVVCRYNISQNDKGIIFCINYPVTSVKIYNNTVYCPANLSPVIISERNNGGSGSRTYTFHNNLIYNLSPTASYDFTSGYNRTIDYNCFFGVHPSSEPSDPHKVTSDPKLVNAGSGGFGIQTVAGYKLTPNSSCINTGKVISGNGNKDFWGNPLYNGTPDIGAHEFTLPPAAPLNLVPTVTPPNQVILNWTDNSQNEAGFRIERSNNAGPFFGIATMAANTLTYTDAVSFDTARVYRVAAFNAEGSAFSNTALAVNCWTGTQNTQWEDPGNWAAAVIPDNQSFNTIFPAMLNPVIATYISIRDLLIKPSGMLTISPDGTLLINANLEINGETLMPGNE